MAINILGDTPKQQWLNAIMIFEECIAGNARNVRDELCDMCSAGYSEEAHLGYGLDVFRKQLADVSFPADGLCDALGALVLTESGLLLAADDAAQGCRVNSSLTRDVFHHEPGLPEVLLLDYKHSFLLRLRTYPSGPSSPGSACPRSRT